MMDGGGGGDGGGGDGGGGDGGGGDGDDEVPLKRCTQNNILSKPQSWIIEGIHNCM
jgi:hypothetical protein